MMIIIVGNDKRTWIFLFHTAEIAFCALLEPVRVRTQKKTTLMKIKLTVYTMIDPKNRARAFSVALVICVLLETVICRDNVKPFDSDAARAGSPATGNDVPIVSDAIRAP